MVKNGAGSPNPELFCDQDGLKAIFIEQETSRL
jgi:hypothetical protein